MLIFMPSAATNYLDPQTLASIGALDLRARMIVEGVMTGMHRSPFQGFSVEFAQHRQYAPGDDIRHLDWKIFGRTDKLYLKQYQQETNLDLLLLVDVSGSMAYTSQQATKATKDKAGNVTPARQAWRKFDHAASLAAAMAYLALGQQDRVGLMMFSSSMRSATRLSNTHDHWRGIVEALASAKINTLEQQAAAKEAADAAKNAGNKASGKASGQSSDKQAAEAEFQTTLATTNLGRVFDEVLAKLTRRSILVLISDLFDDTDALATAMARTHHRGHDLIILQTLDPAEREFPFRGPSEFIGTEGEGRIPLDPEALRKMYLESFGAHQKIVEETARRFHFDHLALDTSQSLGPPLSHFLARRGAMINQGH